MPYCPSCATPLAADAVECPRCRAVFSPGAAWAPVETAPDIAPRRPESWTDVIATVLVRLFVVFIAGIGVALMAFVAMFSAFSGGGAGGVYAACALLFVGLLWAVHPVYEFATRNRRAQARSSD